MSLSLDPALRSLNDCGCCTGVTAALAAVGDRPGLAAVAYRVGQHASFNNAMRAALSATPNAALAGLQTREPDDFSVALIDAWAAALDVLTFYQERIANESYLRTATERQSLLHLARLIGYELRPGVAAGTRLAFTLDETPGAPAEVTLAAGIRVQSIPGPGETSQTFETVEEITCRPAWNAIAPRQTAAQALSPAADRLWLKGVDANLKAGDRLLVVGNLGGALRYALRRVAALLREDAANRTQVDLEPLAYGSAAMPDAAPAGITAGVWALRARAAVFGHNAPKKPANPDKPADIENAEEWDLNEPSKQQLTLDAVYDQVTRDSWIVLDRWWIWLGAALGLPALPGWRLHLLLRVQDSRIVSRADYGITGRATQLTLDRSWLHDWEGSLLWLRDMAAYVQSEPLALAEQPLAAALPANALPLNGDYRELPAGRAIIVSGLRPGDPADAPRISELAVIDGAVTAGGFTTLALKTDLVTVFDRRTVAINANVALATHGETVAEVLGSGDAGRPYQRFTLARPQAAAPLTYTAAATPEGVASSLQVRVNDLLWQEAPTLLGRGPAERIYTTRTADDGRVTVQFGDGKTGARPPTGSGNVRATYRTGIGAAGNLKAGQLSLLLSRPLGLKAVVNPLPAAGGADREAREDARRNAPLTVLTLGRVVSLADYEAFARAFPGIAKALATWTWDGQRQGVCITVAGPDGAAVDEAGQTYANLLAALRAAGDPYVPLWVRSYTAVKFVIAATVTRRGDALAEKVEQAVRAALLAAFSFDARQFGQPVALSAVQAVLQAAPGVAGVDVDALHRAGQPALLSNRLAAFAPRPGAAFGGAPAELMLLDAHGIYITVK